MSKLACALAIVALLMLFALARSETLGVDSSLGMESEMQMQSLENEIAQMSLSEKELHDIVALQAGGDALTAAEKDTMDKLLALQNAQKSRMLKDNEFDLPISLMERHEKCNAQIIEAVLKIIRTAKMQVRSQISKVEAFLTSADYARHMIQMMKYKDQLYRLHQRFMRDAMEVTMNFKGGDQSVMVKVKLLQELRHVADSVRSKKLSPDEARTQIEVLRQSMLEL